jgi:hypothetical protein
MKTPNPDTWAIEKDQLHSVPAQVDALVEKALGRPARMILIIQSDNGGHVFCNDPRANDPAYLAEVLENGALFLRSGKGKHSKVGRTQ